jgi:hypothetical protein
MVQSFRDLQVWQRSMQLTVGAYRFTQNFPREELYGLTSQMARGSNCELRTQLEIARALGIHCSLFTVHSQQPLKEQYHA